jgi:hypothetical protein
MAVITYILALFISFSFGLTTQSSLRSYAGLAETLQTKELLLQEKINLVANSGGTILESMEKVSVIKYLTGKSVAINLK